jgi:hypothetical protein
MQRLQFQSLLTATPLLGSARQTADVRCDVQCAPVRADMDLHVGAAADCSPVSDRFLQVIGD